MLSQCSSEGQPPIAGGHLLLFIPWKNGFFWLCFPCSDSFLLPGAGRRCFAPALPLTFTLQGSSTSLGRGCGSSIPSQPEFFCCDPCASLLQEAGAAGRSHAISLLLRQNLALRRKEAAVLASRQSLGAFTWMPAWGDWQRISEGIERESQNLIRH